MTTNEKNKIIAAFEGSMIIRQYHQDWNELMRVLEKIAKNQPKDESVIHNGEDSYFDNYYPRTFGMINSETKDFMVRINRFQLHQSPSLIEATFEAVVEFIQAMDARKLPPTIQ